MGRLARLVILGLPHHVTQRSNGPAQPFFDATDGGIVALLPIVGRFPPLPEFIETNAASEIHPRLYRAEDVGQPLDSDAFIEILEGEAERGLKQREHGPKPMTESNRHPNPHNQAPDL
jgi:hypothetical protein